MTSPLANSTTKPIKNPITIPPRKSPPTSRSSSPAPDFVAARLPLPASPGPEVAARLTEDKYEVLETKITSAPTPASTSASARTRELPSDTEGYVEAPKTTFPYQGTSDPSSSAAGWTQNPPNIAAKAKLRQLASLISVNAGKAKDGVIYGVQAIYAGIATLCGTAKNFVGSMFTKIRTSVSTQDVKGRGKMRATPNILSAFEKHGSGEENSKRAR